MAIFINHAARLYFRCYSSHSSSNSDCYVGFPYFEKRALLALSERRRGFGLSSVIGNNSSEARRRFLRRFEEDDRRRASSSLNKEQASISLNKEQLDDERPPFDINLAVVLAGFAFEAYNTPPDNKGMHEIDPFGCKTVFLSEQFLREVYDGQLVIQLKRGFHFPGLDLWGTSDPYITLRVGESVVQSKTVWATTEPVWNESFKINAKDPAAQYLQVAAWDANLLTSDRRLGNGGVNLESLADGEMHEVRMELEGIGGGGLVELEVQYQTFSVIDAESGGWKIPLLSDFLGDLMRGSFALEGLTPRDFLNSTLGTLQQTFETKEATQNNESARFEKPSLDATNQSVEVDVSNESVVSDVKENEKEYESLVSGKELKEDFLGKLREGIGHKFGVTVDKIGIPLLNRVSWDAIDVIKKLGLESRSKAELDYLENGLAVAFGKQEDSDSDKQEYARLEDPSSGSTKPLAVDIQKASMDLWRQTEEILQSWAVIATSFSGQKDDEQKSSGRTTAVIKENRPTLQDQQAMSSVAHEGKLLSSEEMEELRKMFGKAESAMEAWAVLATSLGHTSFVKSAFEKICFIDNDKTDTQVAIWRDVQHRRIVVAFRGTEQVKWKDLRTDLMFFSVGFNPERVGGDFKEEAMVHGGFLSAYDSVRNKLMSLMNTLMGSSNGGTINIESPWHVYITGHSLGGALATLLALDLTASRLHRNGLIKVSMYNFGSPRVGNKTFADCYNARVNDSWRVVNHRDIIPTVPRLMGYCHVAQPVYLTAGDMFEATVNMDLIEEGYQGDVIGEATPDFLLEEFMKGEKSLIDRLFQTEIAMLRALRDGSALMQHMEDFYYISLLENASPRSFALRKTINNKTPEA